MNGDQGRITGFVFYINNKNIRRRDSRYYIFESAVVIDYDLRF